MKIHKLWKILVKIKRFIFGAPTEIQFVEASLAKHRAKLNDLLDAFDPTIDCCPSCVYDTYYSNLVNKIERIEHRLKILRNRKQNA